MENNPNCELLPGQRLFGFGAEALLIWFGCLVGEQKLSGHYEDKDGAVAAEKETMSGSEVTLANGCNPPVQEILYWHLARYCLAQ